MNDPELTAEAVRALNEGRKVLRRASADCRWVEATQKQIGYHLMDGDLDSDHVRIAPAPKFVPWGFEDDVMGWSVRRKGFNERLLITAQTELGISLNGVFYHYHDALDKLERPAGQPCGKAVQS